MKKASVFILSLSASPALAHSGLHLHPHGSETIVGVLAGLAVIASAAGMAWLRKR
ncbi:MAG: hypothetical protein ACWA47_04200 [Brevirhabdus sp.]